MWTLTAMQGVVHKFFWTKKEFRGCHFWSEKEVMAAEEWVNGKDPAFFSSGPMALEHRWSKCIEN